MTTPHLKTRFCPSPTGLLHLGNVRTALFNALYAKGQHGTFLLRIEDTDKARSEEQYTDALKVDMRWLGLDWDEGPDCGGDHGPYWQSQRQAIYDNYYQQLEAQGSAYLCFCSEQQLALSRKLQASAGKPPRYAGACRDLTAEQIAAKLAQGVIPTLRFRVPPNQATVFQDMVHGEQRFQNNDIGDFIIRRTDGTPSFMYCNAIDDALMRVTHALRGSDHLTNTPRQVMILQALQLPIPTYGHISLIVSSDGAPLSKRHGSRSLQALREDGYLPLAIANYLARLGHHYTHEQWMSFSELADNFSPHTLGTAPARFDPHQLLHWQHETVLRLTNEELWQWLGEGVHALVPSAQRELFMQTVRPNTVFPADAVKWAHRIYTTDWGYGEAEHHVLHAAGVAFFTTAQQAVTQHGIDLTQITQQLKQQLDVKGKQLFQPLRVALTGELHGPELVPIVELLGAEKVQQRLEKARKIIEK